MPFISATLKSLGESLGTGPLATDAKGLLSLRLGREDKLSFERVEGGILMTLARPLPAHRPGLARKALEATAWERGLPFALRAGLSGENALTLTTRFSERAFVLHEVLACLSLLRDVQSSISAQ